MSVALRTDRAALLLSLFVSSCGGTTPASPTSPSSDANGTAVNLSGTLTAFYDSGRRYSGSTATLATNPPKVASINAAGRFEFSNIVPGTYTLTFAGAEHIARV